MTTFSPEVQAILDRVKSGDPIPKPTRGRPKKTISDEEREAQNARRRATRKTAPTKEEMRKYNYSQIVALFTTLNMSVTDIAEYVGCGRNVVTHALNEAGIPMEDRQIARQPKEMCKRGLHDMEEHAVPLKSGVRTCRPCKVRVARIARHRREGRSISPEDLDFLELSSTA